MEEQEKARESKKLSRRSAIKVVAGLFAFIPAATYLLNASDALAYVPCSNPNNVSCSWQTICADPKCRGYKTWWYFEYCVDLNTGDNCPSYQQPPIDTGQRC